MKEGRGQAWLEVQEVQLRSSHLSVTLRSGLLEWELTECLPEAQLLDRVAQGSVLKAP